MPQAVSDPKKAVGHPRFHFSNPYQPMLPIGHRQPELNLSYPALHQFQRQDFKYFINTITAHQKNLYLCRMYAAFLLLRSGHFKLKVL